MLYSNLGSTHLFNSTLSPTLNKEESSVIQVVGQHQRLGKLLVVVASSSSLSMLGWSIYGAAEE